MIPYSELPQDFHRPIRRELETGEQILWWVQPDPNAILQALLPFTVLWLSGLFLISVGMLRQAPGDSHSLLNGLIFILIIVAVAGVIELIFIPRRAERTVYVLTTKRAFTMCVTKKLDIEEEGDDEKKVLKEDPSTAMGFYLSNLPAQLLLTLAGMDVLRATAHHFDFFLAGGFGLILTGWMLPWISELKLPVAKYREGPRTLYALQDLFITLQVVPRDSIGKLKLRKIHSELYNAIIVTRNSGCLRFRAIPSKAKAESLLQALTSESQVAK